MAISGVCLDARRKIKRKEKKKNKKRRKRERKGGRDERNIARIEK